MKMHLKEISLSKFSGSDRESHVSSFGTLRRSTIPVDELTHSWYFVSALSEGFAGDMGVALQITKEESP